MALHSLNAKDGIFHDVCKFINLPRAFFVTVRGGMAYREMKMTKVYFVCQYCISMIN